MIPNIKLKFVKDDFDRYSLSHRKDVQLGNNHHLFIAPLEVQIPYKLRLGGDKDIEDALYLWEIFQGHLDKKLLRKFMTELGVTGDHYGISI